jgi:hypothetical protein
MIAVPTEEGAVLHGWDIRTGIPSAIALSGPADVASIIPEQEILRRSRDWESRPGEAPNWKIMFTPNVVLRGDVEDRTLRVFGVHLEEFNAMLRRATGGSLPRPFTVRIFSKRDEFCRFAACLGAPNAESLYDPRSGEMVVWFDPGTIVHHLWWLQHILAHEFTHAYMDVVWKRTSPLWFAEGMAEYFSNLEWREDGFVPGMAHPEILAYLRTSIPVPLSRFLIISRDEMYHPAMFRHLYAQAWSLVHFLFARAPETASRLLESGGTLADPSRWEGPWLEHIQGLLGRHPALGNATEPGRPTYADELVAGGLLAIRTTEDGLEAFHTWGLAQVITRPDAAPEAGFQWKHPDAATVYVDEATGNLAAVDLRRSATRED